MAPRSRSWFLALVAIAVLALAVRLVYVFAYKDPAPLRGDAWYYHYAANLLADGKGFISPIAYKYPFALPQGAAADHPPGFIVALALPSLVGLDTPLAHQIWSSVMGTATVVVVGYAGRVLAGGRVGLIAAGLAAVSPNFWLNDGLIMSETLTLLTTAVTILVAYRFWRHPTGLRAGAFGVALAAFALTRAEALILVPLLVVPLAMIAAKREWRRGATLAIITTGVMLLALLPWFVYNHQRFERPVFVSSSLGWTMQSANCAETYRGVTLGYWAWECADHPPTPGDASVQDQLQRKRALEYMRGHLRQLPWVIVAREGRTFGFFRPGQQLQLDAYETTRDRPAGTVGLLMFYALVPAAYFGARILRRRDVPVWPLVSIIVMVVITVALTFGETRYRAPAEVSLVLLGAVALDAVIARARSRNIVPSAARPEPVDELVTIP